MGHDMDMERLSVRSGPCRVTARSSGDLRACVELLWAVHASDGYPAFWPADPTAWLASPRELAAWVARLEDGVVYGHVAIHVAEGHPACHLWSRRSGRSPSGLALISRLVVAPHVRCRGVGTQLLAIATQEARVRGLVPVLDVAQDNLGAIRLYEKAGWRRVGRLDADEKRSIAVFAYLAPDVRTESTAGFRTIPGEL